MWQLPTRTTFWLIIIIAASAAEVEADRDILTVFASHSSYLQWQRTLSPNQSESLISNNVLQGTAYVNCAFTRFETLLGQQDDPTSLTFTISMYSQWLKDQISMKFSISPPSGALTFEQEVNLTGNANRWWYFPTPFNQTAIIKLNLTHLTLGTASEEYLYSHYTPLTLDLFSFLIASAAILIICCPNQHHQLILQRSKLYLNHYALYLMIAKMYSLCMVLLLTMYEIERTLNNLLMLVRVGLLIFYTVAASILVYTSIFREQELWYWGRLVLLTIIELALFCFRIYMVLSILVLLGLQLHTKFRKRSNYYPSLAEKAFLATYCTWFLCISDSFFSLFGFFRMPPSPGIGLVLLCASGLTALFLLVPKSMKRRFIVRGDSEIEQCCICLQQVDESRLFLTECDHGFHKQCIDRWLEHNNLCPLDRQPINRSYV